MSAGRLVAALAGAGLFAGAAAWAAHQQLGYILAARLCRGDEAWLPVLGVAALLALLGGAAMSWLALRQTSPGGPDAVRARRFVATLGLMGASLFGFAVVLQMSAAAFLAPCAR
jgi:hypothetical protein